MLKILNLSYENDRNTIEKMSNFSFYLALKLNLVKNTETLWALIINDIKKLELMVKYGNLDIKADRQNRKRSEYSFTKYERIFNSSPDKLLWLINKEYPLTGYDFFYLENDELRKIFLDKSGLKKDDYIYPIMSSISKDNFEGFKYVIEYFDFDLLDKRFNKLGYDGRTLLHLCYEEGAYNIATYLCDNGLTFDLKDRFGYTPQAIAEEYISKHELRENFNYEFGDVSGLSANVAINIGNKKYLKVNKMLTFHEDYINKLKSEILMEAPLKDTENYTKNNLRKRL